jgi:pentatricopeptide repeat protein
LAPDDAVVWFTQALDLLEQRSRTDPGLRCDLLIGLGTAQRQDGDPGHRETLLEAAALARELPDANRLASAALANNPGRFSVQGASDPERLESLEAAIELLPEDDTGRRAELLSTLAVELSWSDAEHRRRALTDEAIALARRVGDPATLVRVIGRAFHAIYAPDTYEQRLGYALEALDLTERIRDPGLRGLALDRAMWVMLDGGNLTRFDELLAEQRMLADRLGEPVLRFGVELHVVTRVMITGTLEESRQALDNLLEVGNQTGLPEATMTWGTLAGELSVRRGQLAEYVELVEGAVEQFPDMPAPVAALAYAYCELGRMDEARALLDKALERGFGELPRDRLLLLSLAYWAGVAVALSATDVAIRSFSHRTAWLKDRSRCTSASSPRHSDATTSPKSTSPARNPSVEALRPSSGSPEINSRTRACWRREAAPVTLTRLAGSSRKPSGLRTERATST